MATTDNLSDGARNQRWLWLVWSVLFAAATCFELRRFVSSLDNPVGPVAWLLYWDPETTLPFVCLLSLPLLRWISRGRRRRPQSAIIADRQDHPPEQKSVTVRNSVTWSGCGVCCLLFGLSLLSSAAVGSRSIPVSTALQVRHISFADLPPAYHDEYSYLLQARTFLAGHLTYPPMTVRPDLFHQMHVLNEHRTVSRYFPLTGLWTAPFLAFGHPIRGHWLAGGLACVFFYLALRQVAHQQAALTGGLLISLSPGLAVFSNLLLAHQPVMLALSIFTWSFLRMMSTSAVVDSWLAGSALTLAMLGRPMTAAGFALPFGIWLAIRLWRHRSDRVLARGFAVPLLCGMASLAVLNHEATGSWQRTAYQEYTDTFTPRHRYGFHNGLATTDGNESKVLTDYNNWATNLTPGVAVENVKHRLLASLQWSLAIFPILFGVLMAARLTVKRTNPSGGGFSVCQATPLRLLFASVFTLHLVHVPYWYDGIMHWHYVFETAPLLLLLTGVGMSATARQLCGFLSPAVAIGWVVCFVAAGLLPGWVAFPVFDGQSKVGAAVSELAYARTRFEYFNATVASPAIDKPALILIDERNADPQLSYVINPPDLKADVLKCRHPESPDEIPMLQAAFPERTVYTFNPATQRFQRWHSPDGQQAGQRE